MYVKAKKSLGQHFLKDDNIARQISESVTLGNNHRIIEIGPGMGILSRFLFTQYPDVLAVELDADSVRYMRQHYPQWADRLMETDFLKIDLQTLKPADKQLIIAGNFPYNISSQILFRVFENRQMVQQCVGMFQREVALRIASPPGSRDYGILSVLMQAFYDAEYLFTVNETVFAPPPKVKSGVVRFTRNNVQQLACNEKLFVTVVKQAFNQRRKMLRNSLASFITPDIAHLPVFTMRPEQLSVNEFIELCLQIEKTQAYANNDKKA